MKEMEKGGKEKTTVLTKDDILNGIKKRVKIKLEEYENKEIIIRPLSDGEFCSILARIDLSDLDNGEKEIDEDEIYNQEDTNTTSAGGNQEEYNNGSLSTNTGKFNDSSNSNLSRQKGKNTIDTTSKTLVKSNKKLETKNYFDDILKNRDFILMVTEVGIVEPKLSRSALESMYFGVPERIGSKILEISSFLSPSESKKKLKK